MTILLEGQNLSVSTPHIVAGTKDYLSVEIIRGVDWKGLNLHVFFQLDNKTYELITDGDYIGPSAHINLSAGMWQVSATGYEYVDGQLVMKITTNKIGLSVAPAPPESGEDLPYIPPTSIEQIEAIAQSVRDDADAGLFNGEKGDKGDKGDPGTTDYEQLVNKPTKVSDFENDSGYVVGVTGVTYETMFGGEFTVTTATDETHEHPYGVVNLTGYLDKNDAYRVTFDGDVYSVPAQLFTIEDYSGSGGFTGYAYVGNLSLFYLPMDGTLNEPYNVPFLILRYNGNINVYTQVAGEHSILVEHIIFDFERIPANLIYGDMYVPFQQRKTTSKVLEGYSVGCNRFLDGRFMYAFGYGNVVSGEGACAIGAVNRASGTESMALGFGNKAAGNYSRAFGRRNIASGNQSFADGQMTIASGAISRSEGDGCRAAALGSHAEGGGTYADASQPYTHVCGVNNAVSTATGKTVTITRYNEDGTVDSTSTRTLGKYAEVIGNGDSDASRSNARTLDWSGNEELAGGLTLGLGTADETHITAAQLKALLALL